jgi:predicted transcriptional regulator
VFYSNPRPRLTTDDLLRKERAVSTLLRDGVALTTEELMGELNLSKPDLLGVLTRLEIKGTVQRTCRRWHRTDGRRGAS